MNLEYWGQYPAGVDEVGRGPLAGDVVACAVILDPQQPVVGLADSKKLTETQRERLYHEILAKAISVSLGAASVAEIDQMNILQASLLAMQRAIDGLKQLPSYVLVDGNRLPETSLPAEAIVKGDTKVACISAAAIVAKVTRDRQMLALAESYPGYGFEKHKGYPTKAHLEALSTLGASAVHRISFKPVQKVVQA